MSESPDLTLAALKMLISLGVVLAIIWVLYRLGKKNLAMGPSGGKAKMMRVLESQYLGLKKNITMVKVPGAVLVLGISADRVNLLSRIDDPAMVEGIVAGSENQRSALNFKDHLQRLTRPKGGGSLAVPNDSTGK